MSGKGVEAAALDIPAVLSGHTHGGQIVCSEATMALLRRDLEHVALRTQRAGLDPFRVVEAISSEKEEK